MESLKSQLILSDFVINGFFFCFAGSKQRMPEGDRVRIAMDRFVRSRSGEGTNGNGAVKKSSPVTTTEAGEAVQVAQVK